jgi:hypothetical protein
MLRITADVYSGRPNPVAEITDDAEAQAVLGQLAQDRSLLESAESAEVPQGGLGFRGFYLEALGDEIAQDFNMPATVYLSTQALRRSGLGPDVGERLLSLIERGERPVTAEADTALDAPLREYLVEQLTGPTVESAEDAAAPAQAAAPAEAAPAVTCTIELGVFNPGFWNNDLTVRRNNNCYNYASNWRTNTFAQPGRGCGQMYTAITCPEMTRASLCDGVHHRFDCFPDTERPRYLVALVVAPGPGFRDFHWFRKQSGGFWGHKPGGTEARNVDNSGVLITNPETANRGPYTQFCGYFYTCNSQRRRIR